MGYKLEIKCLDGWRDYRLLGDSVRVFDQKDEAVAELERLRGMNPGVTYRVCACTSTGAGHDA